MKKNRLSFLRPLPVLFRYQLIAGVLLWLCMMAINTANTWLMRSAGKAAVSAGDFRFLFTTWQGWLMILFFLSVFFVYTAFDLNVMILVSDRVLKGEKPVCRTILKESVTRIGRLMNLDGLAVVIYIGLLAPLTGVGVTISLTNTLAVPNFIRSVIDSTPLYSVLYAVVLFIFALIGFLHIFTLHGIVLDDMTVRDSRKQSDQIIRANWRDYLKNNAVFTIRLGLMILAAIVILSMIPTVVLLWFKNQLAQIYLFLFLSMTVSLSAVLASPLYILEITYLYDNYTEADFVIRQHHNSWIMVALLLVVVSAALFPVAMLFDTFADALFPPVIETAIIAHRGGGVEAPENTVAGLNKAVELGAWGSEIDIQRTKDGKYVVNHDSTFARTAGVDAAPEELTLAEAKKLSVDGEPVATLEEMCDAAKGKIILFIELKGATADRQMADDAVRVVREKHMEDEAVLISLKYDLISYVEDTYPDIDTGYLTFLSYGNAAELHCDYIGFEERIISQEAVNAVHNAKKKMLVWTPNTPSGQKKYLLSGADAIITDNISQANRIIAGLEERSIIERIIDKLFE